MHAELFLQQLFCQRFLNFQRLRFGLEAEFDHKVYCIHSIRAFLRFLQAVFFFELCQEQKRIWHKTQMVNLHILCAVTHKKEIRTCAVCDTLNKCVVRTIRNRAPQLSVFAF